MGLNVTDSIYVLSEMYKPPADMKWESDSKVFSPVYKNYEAALDEANKRLENIVNSIPSDLREKIDYEIGNILCYGVAGPLCVTEQFRIGLTPKGIHNLSKEDKQRFEDYTYGYCVSITKCECS